VALEAFAANPHHAVKGSLHAGETIVRLQKQNKSAREMQHSAFSNNKSNIKSPGGPRRTTVLDDRRILSMEKKNPFTTSSQKTNTEACYPKHTHKDDTAYTLS